jgi:NAD-dependent dihydropyrimidine dehydrogenase PreA subunit
MKSLKILLRKSKVAILVSVFVILSAFLISTAATASTNGTASTPILKINYEDCLGCGVCEAVAPNCIIMIDGIPTVMLGWYDYYPEWLYAIIDCPVGAISYTNY